MTSLNSVKPDHQHEHREASYTLIHALHLTDYLYIDLNVVSS